MVKRLWSWGGRHPWLSALALLALIACVWLAPVLRGHQLGQSYILVSDPPFSVDAPPPGTLPHRAEYPDAGVTFHPWQVVAREQVRSGRVPLWNPYEYGGQPLLGNMQSALAFPLTWVTFLISPNVAAGLLAIVKLVIAGLGAFGLARAVGVRHWGGALLAGTVYMLSAPMMAWLQWPNAAVYGLYPWLLVATLRLADRPGPAAVAAVGGAFTLTFVAGHPESALASISCAALFLVVLLVARARRPREGGAGPALVGTRWILGGVLGSAGAAVVLLPFLQALDSSVTKSTHGIVSTEIPFYAALQFLAPGLFGNAQPTLYGFSFFTTVAGYFGVPALMLALVAVWRHRLQPVTIALAATAVAAIMATFRVPPVSWWMDEVPPWSSALVSGRVYFIVALAAAVGAGAGYSALVDRPLRLRQAALVTGAVAAALLLGVALAAARDLLQAPASVKWEALALAGVAIAAGAGLLVGLGRLGHALVLPVAIAVAALSMVDLRELNVTLPPREAYPPTPAALRFLQERPWPFRVQAIRPRDTMVPPNILAEYRLESLEGYDFPLDKRWSDLQGAALGYVGLLPERRILFGPPSKSALRTLRLFNVSYYLAAPGADTPPGLRPIYSGADATVFRDPEALPRAFVVPATRPLPDDQALTELGKPGFDPRQVALVPPDAPRMASARESFAPARIRRLSADHLRVELPRDSAGWLVIGNAYSSAWTASVDGAPARLRPTDFAAMGLAVPAGARTVDIRLDRTLPVAGAVISLLALLAMALLAWRGRVT